MSNIDKQLPAPTKRLETLTGFRTFERATLAGGSRADVRAYLEARGFVVYASESLRTMRGAALDDYDGETGSDS